jgi:peptide/nickel transport system ATP-binding protein
VTPPVRLAAAGLDFSYDGGGPTVLHAIDLEIAPGERVGIVGESGSGKTTLAKLLAGVLRSPAVTVNGKPWSRWPRRGEMRRAVQLVQQDPYASLTPQLSARGAVAEAARVAGRLGRREADARATALLAAVGLDAELAGRRPGALSGGQCQRVSIARALAAGPSLLIADESTSALDLTVQAQIIELLRGLTGAAGPGLVLVTHDLGVVRDLTDRVVVMRDGRIVESGPTAAVLAAPRHEYTRLLREADLAVLPAGLR